MYHIPSIVNNPNYSPQTSPRPSPPPFITYQQQTQMSSPILYNESFSSSPSPSLFHIKTFYDEDSNWPIDIRKDTHSTCNLHPIYNFLSYHHLTTSYCSFISSVSSITIPKYAKETLDHLRWRQVVIVEMQALEHNGTWHLILFHLDRRLLVVIGFTQLKLGQMVKLIALKLDW